MKQLTDLPELDAIKKHLKRQEISQLALADASGVPQSVISRIISGAIKDPSYRTLYKIMQGIVRTKNTKEGSTDNEALTAEQLMSRKVVSVKPHNRLIDAWKVMKARNFSQIPVLDESERAIGSISESLLSVHATEHEMNRRIEELNIEETFPTVGERTVLTTVVDLFRTKPAILVVKTGKVVGIITRHDLIEKL